MRTQTTAALSALDAMFGEIDRIKAELSQNVIPRPAMSVTAPEMARRNGTTTSSARDTLEGMVRLGHLQRGIAVVPDARGAAQKTVVYFTSDSAKSIAQRAK